MSTSMELIQDNYDWQGGSEFSERGDWLPSKSIFISIQHEKNQADGHRTRLSYIFHRETSWYLQVFFFRFHPPVSSVVQTPTFAGTAARPGGAGDSEARASPGEQDITERLT